MGRQRRRKRRRRKKIKVGSGLVKEGCALLNLVDFLLVVSTPRRRRRRSLSQPPLQSRAFLSCRNLTPDALPCPLPFHPLALVLLFTPSLAPCPSTSWPRTLIHPLPCTLPFSLTHPPPSPLYRHSFVPFVLLTYLPLPLLALVSSLPSPWLLIHPSSLTYTPSYLRLPAPSSSALTSLAYLLYATLRILTAPRLLTPLLLTNSSHTFAYLPTSFAYLLSPPSTKTPLPFFLQHSNSRGTKR